MAATPSTSTSLVASGGICPVPRVFIAGRITLSLALDAMYAAHPERFVHGPPHVALPPREVSINPQSSQTVVVLNNVAFSIYPPSSDGAQDGSRAAQPASCASEPVMRPSTGASSRVRRNATRTTPLAS
jgi:hypothetical protein